MHIWGVSIRIKLCHVSRQLIITILKALRPKLKFFICYAHRFPMETLHYREKFDADYFCGFNPPFFLPRMSWYRLGNSTKFQHPLWVTNVFYKIRSRLTLENALLPRTDLSPHIIGSTHDFWSDVMSSHYSKIFAALLPFPLNTRELIDLIISPYHRALNKLKTVGCFRHLNTCGFVYDIE